MNRLAILFFIFLIYSLNFTLAKNLTYTGNPFLVNASYKASNIIILPEPVKNAYSSTKGVKVNFNENAKKVLVVIPNKPSDLVIEGESGTLYVFNLNPMALPSQIFTVKNKSLKKRETIIFEAKNPIEDTISNIIKAVILGKSPYGYDKKPFSIVVASNDVIVIGKAIYDGGIFKVYVADIINKSHKVLRIREDSKFALELAKRLSNLPESDIRAIAINREILNPKSKEKADWYATYFLIVSKKKTSYLLKSFYEGK